MIDLKKIVRPNILELKPYSSARDEYSNSEGIFLDANENPFGSLNRYPDPYQKAVKERLAAFKNIPAENIFIGNGSDEVIDLAFRIFCTPGKDKALSFAPTYGMYKVSAGINAVDLQEIPLNQDFQIDTSELATYFSDERYKLLFICSPNNPTGNYMDLDSIKFILQNFKGIVFIDEAYIDFSEQKSCIELVQKYNNLIVSQTFSKAWGLAGARVGTAYANAEIIALYNKVKPPYNVSTLNQDAILNALNNLEAYQTNLETIKTQKKSVEKQLREIDAIQKIYPSDANFLLLKIENANKVYNQLMVKNIIVRNRSKQIPNTLRITIGTPEENQKLIDTLKNIA